MKNVKGETNVGKESHIPYISHKAIINVPSQNPYSTDMGDVEGPSFSAAGPEVLWVISKRKTKQQCLLSKAP